MSDRVYVRPCDHVCDTVTPYVLANTYTRRSEKKGRPLRASTRLNDTEKMLIELADNKFLLSESFADPMGFRNGWGIVEGVFFELASNTGIADSLVVSWRDKIRNDHVRPTSIVHSFMGDHDLKAWRGPGDGQVGKSDCVLLCDTLRSNDADRETRGGLNAHFMNQPAFMQRPVEDLMRAIIGFCLNVFFLLAHFIVKKMLWQLIPVRCATTPDGQGVDVKGRDWQPYIRVMPHSEHPSGSSCICSVLFDVARLVMGRDAWSTVVNFKKGSSVVEPGLTPAKPITWCGEGEIGMCKLNSLLLLLSA